MIISAAEIPDSIIIKGIVVAVVVLVGVIIAAVLVKRSAAKRKKEQTADDESVRDGSGGASVPEDRTAEDMSESAPCDSGTDVSVESFTQIESDSEAQPEVQPEADMPEEDPEEAQPVKKQKESRVRTSRRAAGSWTVEYKRLGEYVAVLCAKNGEPMLSSETYSTEEGARAGIGTIVKNITGGGTFVIYRDKNDNYYFKLKTAGNKFLCVGETYRSKDQCEKAMESVKRLAPTAPVSGGLSESDEYIEYSPATVTIPPDAAPGRWQIESMSGGMFRAKLYAANGQLMLTTEEVSSQRTAIAVVESIKKNAADGNFVIDRDKFGRYYYKLRNARKSVICMGESYDSLPSCVKAIETVRRYCATAVLPV